MKSMRAYTGMMRRMASFMQLMAQDAKLLRSSSSGALSVCFCRLFGMAGECAGVALCWTLSGERAELRCTYHVPARASRACVRV